MKSASDENAEESQFKAENWNRLYLIYCPYVSLKSHSPGETTVHQTEGLHVRHCGQQHWSTTGDHARYRPLHRVHIQLPVKLWALPHAETLGQHCDSWLYQGWTGGGVQEPGQGLHDVVQVQPSAAERLQDQGHGGGLQKEETTSPTRVHRGG